MDDGLRIFEKYVEEIGGEEAIRRIASFHVSGKYVLQTSNLEGTIELWFQRPGRLLFRVEIPEVGRIERGFDGTTAWSIHPQTGTEILKGAALDDVRRWVVRGFSLLPEAGAFRSIELSGQEVFAGRPCHRLEVALAATDHVYVDYYDVKTGLFAGRVERMNSPVGEIELRGVAGDYRRFGDLMIPTFWEHEASGQKWSAVYTAFEANSVEASVFEPPEPIRRILAGEPASAAPGRESP